MRKAVGIIAMLAVAFALAAQPASSGFVGIGLYSAKRNYEEGARLRTDSLIVSYETTVLFGQHRFGFHMSTGLFFPLAVTTADGETSLMTEDLRFGPRIAAGFAARILTFDSTDLVLSLGPAYSMAIFFDQNTIEYFDPYTQTWYRYTAGLLVVDSAVSADLRVALINRSSPGGTLSLSYAASVPFWQRITATAGDTTVVVAPRLLPSIDLNLSVGVAFSFDR